MNVPTVPSSSAVTQLLPPQGEGRPFLIPASMRKKEPHQGSAPGPLEPHLIHSCLPVSCLPSSFPPSVSSGRMTIHLCLPKSEGFLRMQDLRCSTREVPANLGKLVILFPFPLPGMLNEPWCGPSPELDPADISGTRESFYPQPFLILMGWRHSRHPREVPQLEGKREGKVKLGKASFRVWHQRASGTENLIHQMYSVLVRETEASIALKFGMLLYISIYFPRCYSVPVESEIARDWRCHIWCTTIILGKHTPGYVRMCWLVLPRVTELITEPNSFCSGVRKL